ncbi:hypothetical protein PM082_024891 [Marasmius tenuissimus]|nr:hypothetical protein PM082_024891 [Marasmius tenuissimus]
MLTAWRSAQVDFWTWFESHLRATRAIPSRWISSEGFTLAWRLPVPRRGGQAMPRLLDPSLSGIEDCLGQPSQVEEAWRISGPCD